MKVKKGDEVVVIAGKDRGVKGKVIAANPETNRVVVEGVNRVTKHTAVGTSARGAKTGGIEHIEAPITRATSWSSTPRASDPHRLPPRRGVRPQRSRLAPLREGPVMSAPTTDSASTAIPRLKARYRAEIVPALQEQFSFGNPMQVPV